MKRTFCIILAALFTLLTFAACSNSDKNDTPTASYSPNIDTSSHPLYIRAEKDCDSVTARFTSTTGDAVMEGKMREIEREEDFAIYTIDSYPSDFDRVTITINDRSSDELAYNEYTSGWELYPGRELPFNFNAGTSYEKPKYERVEFPYQERNKGIEIWTPSYYDNVTADKYSVIYMTDGHNLFEPTATSTGSWAVAESVEAMMAQCNNKVIIVGVENMDGWRDDELTPNIGETDSENYKDGHGAYFCDFVVETVMPYIEEHYNVYTDREHTAICGSSSGGIESFYIAMEHPEKFGTVGALSPAFDIFDRTVWQSYLKEKDFSAGYPRVYLYCGGGDDLEKWLYSGFEEMPDNLASIGYPAENIVSVSNEKAVHNELYWRIVFPDFLKFMFGEST